MQTCKEIHVAKEGTDTQNTIQDAKNRRSTENQSHRTQRMGLKLQHLRDRMAIDEEKVNIRKTNHTTVIVIRSNIALL